MLILPVHSTADVMTNSSNEMFIGNTTKSKKKIEEMLSLLAQAIDKHHGVGKIKIKKGPMALLDVLRGLGSYVEGHRRVAWVIEKFIPWDVKIDVPEIPAWEYHYEPDEEKNKANIEREKAIREEAWNDLARWFEENDALLKEHIRQFVVVTGETDNAIPYELFDVLESQLNAVRFHLG